MKRIPRATLAPFPHFPDPPHMHLDLSPAAPSDAPTLANLFQFYVYDLAHLVNANLAADGRFTLPSIDPYWSDDWRHPFLIRVDGHLAGFALVNQRSRITGDTSTWDVAEFFVMRRFRRQGVGAAVAVRLFDKFRGGWEVRELRDNQPAIDFWRRVIADYTKGQFQETAFDDERWRGPVQSFRS